MIAALNSTAEFIDLRLDARKGFRKYNLDLVSIEDHVF